MKDIAHRFSLVLVFIGALIAIYLWHIDRQTLTPKRVFAQSDPYFAQLTTTNGGMAQYGTALQSSTSSAATSQAVSNFNSYVQARSNWWLTSDLVNRLVTAEWNARVNGPANITAQQLANAVNHLIAVKLAGMTATQQASLYDQMMFEQLPNGTYFSPNSGTKYVTVSQNLDGTFSVVVSANAFSDRKTLFQQRVPSMVSSGSNFYPAEAELIFYSVASGDMGWGNDTLGSIKTKLASSTGLDFSSRLLFGDQGYLVRRPMQVFCDSAGMSQLFSDLGF